MTETTVEETPRRTDQYGRIWFENTFMPRCTDKEVSVENVRLALSHGFVKPEDVPKDVLEEVESEIAYRQKTGQKSYSLPSS